MREQLASFERSLSRFLHWCSRRPATCTLDPDDPEDDFDALVARMNETPLPAAGGAADRRRATRDRPST